jgi:hypothetical protein
MPFGHLHLYSFDLTSDHNGGAMRATISWSKRWWQCAATGKSPVLATIA